jgi:hypothetical protein
MVAAFANTAANSLSPASLLGMATSQLEELYQASPAGPIPMGDTMGTAIIAPGTPLVRAMATFVRLFQWQGKVFDPAAGTLRNKITPFGVRAIVAKVYKGTSWIDGNECIVLDYSKTSLIARWVRDEIREVAPGLYLGVALLKGKRVIDFALHIPPQRKDGE